MESNLRNRLSIALDLIDRQLTPGFYRGKPYQAPDVVVPQDIQIPEHKVQKKYLDYIEIDWKRKMAGKVSKKPPVRPYGQFELQIAETGKTKTLAIAGPANWGQLWTTIESIGEEYNEEIDYEKALIQKHFDYLQSLDQSMESMDILNNIEFIELLGEGGTGQVWQVRAMMKIENTNNRMPIHLACKVVRLPSLIKYSQMDQNFQKNLENNNYSNIFCDMLALRYLKHKHICNLIDVIQIPDTRTGFPFATVCLFLDLCDGDLSQILNSSQKLTERQSKHWSLQICEAIEYLHKLNVYHRDIHLQNIFYNKKHPSGDPVLDSTFKLGDFGLAVCYRTEPSDYFVFHETPKESKSKDMLGLRKSLVECQLGSEESWNWFDDPLEEEEVRAEKLNSSLDFANLIQLLIEDNVSVDKVLAHIWFNG